jgi:hypothetical protein
MLKSRYTTVSLRGCSEQWIKLFRRSEPQEQHSLTSYFSCISFRVKVLHNINNNVYECFELLRLNVLMFCSLGFPIFAKLLDNLWKILLFLH